MKVFNNNVQLIGNLGKEVEITTFESGSKKATVSLATTDYYKNNKGELVKNTAWHNIIAWGKVAEKMASQLSKGHQVAVQGSIAYRNYEANGTIKSITEIQVSEFMRLTKVTE